ncbi:MAG: serine/threonine-protein kinase [Parahaliea sp.]
MSDPYIGRYRILRLIRRGGQGSVFLGYDERLQRRVAVKLYHLPPERAERRRVLDEARIIAGIDSDRVVKIYDVIRAGQYLAMVMTYVPGIDLEELLQRGPLSLNAILNLGIDVSAALASVRQQQIVHGDLKASNVLVARSGRALLTDFGIASQPGRAKNRHGPASESALCPEMVRGEPLDVRSDLFALGSLLYRLVSGSEPFFTRGQFDLRKLMHGEPAALPPTLGDGMPVPPGLVDLIQRLLQKEPANRPDNTHRVRQILRSLAQAEPQLMQHLPLAGVRSLQRGESDHDLPPLVPLAFRGDGRSQLKDWRGFSELTPADVLRLLGKRQVQAGLLGPVLLVMLLLALVWPREQRVQLSLSDFHVDPRAELPAGLSVEWLRAEVCRSALEADARLRFYGVPASQCPAADAGMADNLPRPAADEELHVGLRCSRELCLLGLTRRRYDDDIYRQAVLIPAMPLIQWRSQVRELVLASYSYNEP